ncbi:MAG: dTMP kinase [Marvinbryantia sp.]|uniref:dTMP kinase n=1 Tax=Marvinbryantia sp. TaxID=2496532 RepID=UPI0026661666|nr:thymidylate kinase [uncultured Marvinbryantia sp.]
MENKSAEELFMKGQLVVIEGLDGSGKATQAKLLYEEILKKRNNVRKVSFPDYGSDSSALIKMYLSGQFGSAPSDVNAYAASSFYAVDRYASYKKDWGNFYDDGWIVIADRYTTSNAIHQCSKLPKGQWDAFLDWLFHFEYQLLGIPEPGMVVYLRVDPQVSQKLMTGRYEGHEERKDIHEKDVGYLSRCRDAADYCADRFGWKLIECTRNGEMRTIEDIQKEIVAVYTDNLDHNMRIRGCLWE